MTICPKFLFGLALIVLLLTSTTCDAQYISTGYIVTAAKDTIRGFIREDSDDNLLSRTSFSRDGSDFQVQNVYQINAFGFDYGRTFLGFDKPFTKDRTRFFGKRLVVGKLNLYSVGSFGYIFVKDTVEVLVRPSVTRVVSGENGVLHRTKDKKYITLMSELMQDAPQNLIKVKYTTSQITQATEKYNTVFAKQYPSSTYEAHRITNLVLTGGYGPSSNGAASQFGISFEYEIPERNFITAQSGILYYSWNWQFSGPPQGTFATKQQYVGIYPIGVTLRTRPAKVRAYLKFDVGVFAITKTTYRSYGFDVYTGQFVLTQESDISDIKWMFLNGASGLRVALGRNAIMADVSRVFGNSDLQKNVMLNLRFAVPIYDNKKTKP